MWDSNQRSIFSQEVDRRHESRAYCAASEQWCRSEQTSSFPCLCTTAICTREAGLGTCPTWTVCVNSPRVDYTMGGGN